MIKYILPDTHLMRPINNLVCEFRKLHPHIFIDDMDIVGAYGVLANTCFSGGRNTLREVATNKQIRHFIEEYKKNGIEYRFVFTNSIIDETHLNDVFGNIQLNLAEEYDLPVIVHSNILEDYIREIYPNIRLISSTTKMLSYNHTLEELDKDYSVVVLNTQFNNRLDEFPEEYRSKIEILVNDCCPPFCPNRIACYQRSSKINLGLDIYDYTEENGVLVLDDFDSCKNEKKQMMTKFNDTYYRYHVASKSVCEHMNLDEVIQASKQGYELFKICGREKSPIALLLMYADYLVKPEYRQMFIMDMLQFMNVL